ncbi:polycystin-2-like protein 1 isoform X2 [Branchiostoma lanceolatum]|uniref:polycystin-2-like protein 1 isoform X2 n=1 Tax=Branchiostoma lanceolatum TaxID=7740 RepID=UPI003453AFEC
MVDRREDRRTSLAAREEMELGQRPGSAARSGAWDNRGYDGSRPTSPARLDASAYARDSYGSPAAIPSEMESEMYVHGGTVRAVQPAGPEQQTGCWNKFKRFIRGIWATRLADDVEPGTDAYIKIILRELWTYLAFITILSLMTFGMMGSTMFYFTKVMEDLFLDSSLCCGSGSNNYRGMTSMADWWKFSRGPLLDGLYWTKWYNQNNVSGAYIYYENKMLGVPRIRQIKVRNDSCAVHEDFKDEILECFDSYSEAVEEKDPFGLALKGDNTTVTWDAWFHKDSDEIDGSGHRGKLTSYAGNGYIQDLNLTRPASEAKILELFTNLWTDRGTRVVFIDFTVYNANINLFCVVRLTAEFPPTGGLIPSFNFRTVKLLRYVTNYDFFIMACEGLYVLFIIYYIIEEALEIKRHRLGYFKSFSNILDVTVILLSLAAIAFNVYRTLKVEELLDQLLESPETYADFEFLAWAQGIYNDMVAITVFFAWIKVFKYISFNKTMTQLSSTLARCAKDIAGFLVMFFIIFFAYAQLGYLVFGTQVKDFSTFPDAIFTLFRIILGDFDFNALEEANRVLGPMFFITYILLVFFVLLNMFLAIINDTYSEVKEEIAQQKSEFEIGDYFKKGYNKMLNKLQFKRDKIVDIQKALAAADINSDQQVDFEEWRQDLKARGHADAEIEAVFAKYDIDGDRVLDPEEQKKMQADLEGQKQELSDEIEDVEKARENAAVHSKSRASFHDMMSGDEDDDRPVHGVSFEEFTVLSRRVDRMEHSIGSIVSKIDAVLVKLEAMERAKLKRRETMGKLLDSITEDERAGRTDDDLKREQMERLVREELERWDSEASISNASGRGNSPASGGRPRSRGSRPPSADHGPSGSSA